MPLRCDTIFEKGEKKVCQKGLEPGSTVLKDILARDLPSAPLELVYYVDSAVVSVIPPVHLD